MFDRLFGAKRDPCNEIASERMAAARVCWKAVLPLCHPARVNSPRPRLGVFTVATYQFARAFTTRLALPGANDDEERYRDKGGEMLARLLRGNQPLQLRKPRQRGLLLLNGILFARSPFNFLSLLTVFSEADSRIPRPGPASLEGERCPLNATEFRMNV